MKFVICLFAIFLCNNVLSQDIKWNNLDIKDKFSKYNLDGLLLIYDEDANIGYAYNEVLKDTMLCPASTFKIPNSIFALSTGVVNSVDDTIEWDHVERQNPKWNKTQSLKVAFENSTVWYYQEVARRIGKLKMDSLIGITDYGNNSTAGEIDMFWLTGNLKISPLQQLNFLKRLVHNDLPFSNTVLNQVKQIMVRYADNDFTLHAKTGWSSFSKQEHGWYVGYVERNSKIYYFVSCVFVGDKEPISPFLARKIIVHDVLMDLNIIPSEVIVE